MSIKTEICYKFFFPKYNSLSISPDGANFVPDSDGLDQLGEVRALCRACPERVITYDQLDADNPIAMYANKWDNNPSAPYSRAFIKGCIDKYLEFPKYFNLRNYLDAYPCQEGGMSLMISHSPEIGQATDYTKFSIKENNSDIDKKIVYCTVMISSGDFFYSYCLPSEVIAKSGLKNEIVINRFHQNWYFNMPEKRAYRPHSNVFVGQEKRVFVQHYFKDDFNYVHQSSGTPFYYVNFTYKDNSNNTIIISGLDECLSCCDKNGSYISSDGDNYIGSNKNFPPEELIDHYFVRYKDVIKRDKYGNIVYDENNNIEYTYNADISVYDIQQNRATFHRYEKSEVTTTSGGMGVLKSDPSIVVSPVSKVELYNNLSEDIKQDFIELEATRRILFYNKNNPATLYYNNLSRPICPTRGIPTILSGIGKNTALSYQPPAEYIDVDYTYSYNTYYYDSSQQKIVSSTNSIDAHGTPPLQIPYNLLRYCLNDRPPFTDCETVLIMWIADSDPNDISDSDPDKIKKLHDLNWQQYAIPISMRCYTKDNTTNTNRFLVLYPHASTSIADDEYAYHYRRAENYNKNIFKEAAYIQDLIKYSTDYIIAYNHTSYFSSGFNIQKYLCNKYVSKFRALYVKKAYSAVSYKREFQTYYVKVDNSDNIYHINTSLSDRCFAAGASGSANFIPSQSLTRAKYEEKWSLTPTITNEWLIRDDWFIALFDASDESIFLKRTGKLTLYSSSNLRTYLQSIYSDATWDDIYISSLGISPTDQVNGHFVKTSHFNGSTIILPLGILDGYIQIDGITYGSNTSNHLAIVGLKDVFDYTQDDYHHFKYVSGTYQLTKGNNNNYTAYVMKIQ